MTNDRTPACIVKDPQGGMHMLVIEHMTGAARHYYEWHIRPDVPSIRTLAGKLGVSDPGASLTGPPEDPRVEGAYRDGLARWERAHTHGAVYLDAIGRPPRPGYEHLPPAPDRPLADAAKDPQVTTNELRAIAEREIDEVKVRAARDWERGLAGLEAFSQATDRIGAPPLERGHRPPSERRAPAPSRTLGRR